jgi:hypothetical protein
MTAGRAREDEARPSISHRIQSWRARVHECGTRRPECVCVRERAIRQPPPPRVVFLHYIFFLGKRDPDGEKRWKGFLPSLCWCRLFSISPRQRVHLCAVVFGSATFPFVLCSFPAHCQSIIKRPLLYAAARLEIAFFEGVRCVMNFSLAAARPFWVSLLDSLSCTWKKKCNYIGHIGFYFNWSVNHKFVSSVRNINCWLQMFRDNGLILSKIYLINKTSI